MNWTHSPMTLPRHSEDALLTCPFTPQGGIHSLIYAAIFATITDTGDVWWTHGPGISFLSDHILFRTVLQRTHIKTPRHAQAHPHPHISTHPAFHVPLTGKILPINH